MYMHMVGSKWHPWFIWKQFYPSNNILLRISTSRLNTMPLHVSSTLLNESSRIHTSSYVPYHNAHQVFLPRHGWSLTSNIPFLKETLIPLIFRRTPIKRYTILPSSLISSQLISSQLISSHHITHNFPLSEIKRPSLMEVDEIG